MKKDRRIAGTVTIITGLIFVSLSCCAFEPGCPPGIRFFIRLVLFASLLVPLPVLSQTFDLAPDERQNLAPLLELAKDEGQSLLQVIEQKDDLIWLHNEAQTISLGYRKSGYWFRVRIANPDKRQQTRLLEIANPILDHISIYVRSGWGDLHHFEIGDSLAFAERPLQQRNPSILLKWFPHETQEIYLYVKTTAALQFPVQLWRPPAWARVNEKNNFGLGLYYGVMLVMGVYNLFVYLSVRDRSYLFYVLYVASITVFVGCMQGVTYQYLWLDSYQWNNAIIFISLALVVIFACAFTRSFLHVDFHSPALDFMLLTVIVLTVLTLLVAALWSYTAALKMLVMLCILGGIAVFVTALARWHAGEELARFYLLAWSTLIMGSIVFAVSKFSLLPQNFMTDHAVQVGSAIETVLLSFALAQRINLERKRRFQAQSDALKSERMMREAQQEVMQLQQKNQGELERRVKERTLNLENVNRKLEQLSRTDGLTGLKNRRSFDQAIRKEFFRSYRNQRSISLIILDIDNFKDFNDNFGHLVGDQCLKAVAYCLSEITYRPGDLVARYGGEEFCILLPDTPLKGAGVIAEKIRHKLQDLEIPLDRSPAPEEVLELTSDKALSGATGQRDEHQSTVSAFDLPESVRITVSLGVAACVPGTPYAMDAFIEAADRALYDSKDAGKNCVTLKAFYG